MASMRRPGEGAVRRAGVGVGCGVTKLRPLRAEWSSDECKVDQYQARLSLVRPGEVWHNVALLGCAGPGLDVSVGGHIHTTNVRKGEKDGIHNSTIHEALRRGLPLTTPTEHANI